MRKTKLICLGCIFLMVLSLIIPLITNVNAASYSTTPNLNENKNYLPAYDYYIMPDKIVASNLKSQSATGAIVKHTNQILCQGRSSKGITCSTVWSVKLNTQSYSGGTANFSNMNNARTDAETYTGSLTLVFANAAQGPATATNQSGLYDVKVSITNPTIYNPKGTTGDRYIAICGWDPSSTCLRFYSYFENPGNVTNINTYGRPGVELNYVVTIQDSNGNAVSGTFPYAQFDIDIPNASASYLYDQRGQEGSESAGTGYYRDKVLGHGGTTPITGRFAEGISFPNSRQIWLSSNTNGDYHLEEVTAPSGYGSRFTIKKFKDYDDGSQTNAQINNSGVVAILRSGDKLQWTGSNARTEQVMGGLRAWTGDVYVKHIGRDAAGNETVLFAETAYMTNKALGTTYTTGGNNAWKSFSGWYQSHLEGAPATGAIIQAKQTIVYVYKAGGSVDVTHKVKGTDTIIEGPTAVQTNVAPGTPYSTSPKAEPVTFNGKKYYNGTLASGSAAANGTVEGSVTKHVIYEYEPGGTVRVIHKSTDGTVLQDWAIVQNDVKAGTGYTTSQGSFSGYTYKSNNTGAAPNGTVQSGTTLDVIYLYEPNGSVTVTHKAKDTGNIIEGPTAVKTNVAPGTPYETTVKADGFTFEGKKYYNGALASGSAAASGTVQSGKTLAVVYEYVPGGNVRVRHEATDGTVLRDWQNVVEAGSKPGTGYTTSQETFSGYTFSKMKDGSASAEGTVQSGKTLDVIYVYAPNGSVEVVHKIKGTNTIIEGPTAVKTNVAPGTPYTTSPKSDPVVFNGTKYYNGTLASGSAPAEGLVQSGTTLTVVYEYEPGGSVDVVHKIKGTNTIIDGPTDVLVDVAPGTPYSTSPKSEPVVHDGKNYYAGTISSDSAAASGTIQAGTTLHVIYEYIPGGNVIVEHRIKGTTTVIDGPFNVKVDAKPGTSYETAPKDDPVEYNGINYYHGTVATESAAANGTVESGKTLKVIYEYEPSGSVIVKHITKDTQEVIEGPTEVLTNVEPGIGYTTSPKTGTVVFNGKNYYHGTITSSSAAANGTVQAGKTLEVIYEYEPGGNVNIIHRIKNEDQDVIESGSVKVDAEPGTPYTTSPKDDPVIFEDQKYYHGTLAEESDLAEGTVESGVTKTVIYEYVPGGNVIVRHVTDNFEIIEGPTAVKVDAEPGTPYETSPKSNPVVFNGVNYYNGKIFIVDPEDEDDELYSSAPANGTVISGETLEVIYIYEPGGNVTVKHITKDTHEVIEGPNPVLTDAADGTEYETSPLQGPLVYNNQKYYNGTWVSTSAPISGTAKTGKTLEVVYEYEPGGSVDVTHKIKGTDTIIEGPTTIKDDVEPGTGYTTSPKDDPIEYDGHKYYNGTLSDDSDPAKGTVESGVTTHVVYEYVLGGSVVVIHRTKDTHAIIEGPTNIFVEVAPGTPYETSAISGSIELDGKKYSHGVLAEESAAASGTVDAGVTKVVIYEYEPNGSIRVKHIDSKTKEVLKDWEYVLYDAEPGTPYETSAIEVEGYREGVVSADGEAGTGTIRSGVVIDVIYEYVKDNGYLEIIKTGNELYSVEGAEFTVYTNEACTQVALDFSTDEAAKLIIGSNGVSNKVNLEANKTYWVKETKAPEPYKLNTTVESFTISDNETTTVNFTNELKTGKFRVVKTSNQPEFIDAYPMTGAQFTVYTDEECTQVAVRPDGSEIVITVGNNNKTDYAEVVPGTYYIKETLVPDFYQEVDTILSITVGYQDTLEIEFENKLCFGIGQVIKTW